ncbi:uncharacterized protein LOC141643040 [Silene latifolia]|uniref:uncharacterized protein LOC141643040 n=1 Tax=Silene latifolia TaxID=37657 RepID=UPI003D773BEF
MRVNIAQSHPPPSTSSSLSPHSSQNALPSSLRLHRSSSSPSVLSLSTSHNHLRRSCSATFDGHDFPNDHFTPKPKPTPSSITTSFLHHADVLEPSYLGICTDPPDWPARDAIMRECVARRVNCIDIPLSLRMIKMKQKFLKLEEERDVHFGDSNNNNINNSLNNLCYSTLNIIREIQSYALKSRGIALNEGFDDVIMSKVQREMSSSFVWLIKEVFAKTPDLMLQTMVITSNFALFSLQSFSHVESEKKDANLGGNLVNLGVGHLELRNLGVAVPTREILENMVDTDVGLWESIVDEADHLRGDLVIDQGLKFVVVDRDRDGDEYNGSVEEIEGLFFLEHKKFEIVSPVKVKIESDDYEEYHRTDLLYQSGLFQEPNNTLLLSNYSQFLCLVSRDYDRAEECLKRAIQLDPSDAEIVSQYANFLWIIRNDLWGAEERFQQAMAAEPENSYHASKYANFLWNTGGDETCYPIDD